MEISAIFIASNNVHQNEDNYVLFKKGNVEAHYLQLRIYFNNKNEGVNAY